MDDDWRKWKNGRYDNRYRGVKRHSGQRGHKRTIAISVIVAGALIFGFFIFQNQITSQIPQKEASEIIANTSNTIQQLSSQVVSKQMTGSSMPSYTLTDNPNRVYVEGYYAQFTPYNLQVIAKDRYNVIKFLVNVTVANLPFDNDVMFNAATSTTLKDENSNVFDFDPVECQATTGSYLNNTGPYFDTIYGKQGDSISYPTCYSVDKSLTKFTIWYQEQQTISSGKLWQIGTIDLTK